MPPAAPRFFRTPADLRLWLATYGARRTELVVGFPKKGSGLKGITYPEALDEALCFGWIDSVLVPVDDRRYACRFTPRRPRSVWSPTNVKRVGELRRAGRMTPAGLAAFARRDRARSALYAQALTATLSPADAKRLAATPKARAYFEAQPPGYRRTAALWVMSAVKEETRERRLATLITDSAAGRRIAPLAPRPERPTAIAPAPRTRATARARPPRARPRARAR